jgi:hypothetical protein
VDRAQWAVESGQWAADIGMEMDMDMGKVMVVDFNTEHYHIHILYMVSSVKILLFKCNVPVEAG